MAASYPTSIKSYTTKVDDVDDVDAAHMNSVQEEIVAIETALGAGMTNPVVQVQNTQTGSMTTGSTILSWDDTVPQNTEGDQVMSLAITPKSATNKLKIDVVVHFSNNTSGANRVTAALFQDSTASALAAGCHDKNSNENDLIHQICFSHYMTSGTTSSTTFKVRLGASAASTTTFNGEAGARFLGGVMASSITITEIKV